MSSLLRERVGEWVRGFRRKRNCPATRRRRKNDLSRFPGISFAYCRWVSIASIMRVFALATAVLSGSTVTASGSSSSSPVSTMPWPVPSRVPLNVSMGYGTVTSTGTRFSWYAALLDDLSRFSIRLPAAGGCAVRAETTATAADFGCEVATNAGFFQFAAKPTYCLGEAVVDSKIEQWSDDSSPLFGVTADRTSFVGTISREQVASMKVTYAVSGFGVIVQDGAASPSGVKRAGVTALAHQHMLKGFDDADASFATWAEEVAPRTVVALDKEGRLALVAIDGVEALDLGLTLPETAEIFADKTKGFPLGGEIAHAVNMDGGGSTTFAKTLPNSTAPAQLFNRPTSTDVGDIVERNVTSIACIAASA
eukprot:INCI9878.1.p1 GENE.INCI9878.1~~INCI9878.1.p1  ORF type:complete len:366 (-),score=60.92 INCI9878.1:376-1473(-)